MFRNGPLAADAAKVSKLARGVTGFLAEIGVPGADMGLRVACHTGLSHRPVTRAFSLHHGQKVKDAPRTQSRRAGFEVVEPAEAHLCCGPAGRNRRNPGKGRGSDPALLCKPLIAKSIPDRHQWGGAQQKGAPAVFRPPLTGPNPLLSFAFRHIVAQSL
ncbi:MAG: hypothetical protein CSA74_04365 [Rhodobacterales bacterium]|nr:MAG: hypothetical protein CSA74_04365 [Rhodobacterales bacterium]